MRTAVIGAIFVVILIPLLSFTRQSSDLQQCGFSASIPQKYIPFAKRDAAICVRRGSHTGGPYSILG